MLLGNKLVAILRSKKGYIYITFATIKAVQRTKRTRVLYVFSNSGTD